VVDSVHESKYDWQELLSLVAFLRSDRGCPWDREQTHGSIRQNLLEEAYEVCEAIDSGDSAHLCEELGDLLMQVVFHARIAEESGSFSLGDVIDGLCRKLVTRHPHVFRDATAGSADEVLAIWEEIKQGTRGQTTQHGAMQSVSRGLPALMRAEKIQSKASKVGFDWPDVSGAWDKLMEELSELRDAVSSGVGMEEELGDLLFSAVNVSRFLKVGAERALERACDKFTDRFGRVEGAAISQGRSLREMTLAEMDLLWENEKVTDGTIT